MEIGLKNLRIIKEALGLTIRQMVVLDKIERDGSNPFGEEAKESLCNFLNAKDELNITIEDVRSLYQDIDTRIRNVIDMENLD